MSDIIIDVLGVNYTVEFNKCDPHNKDDWIKFGEADYLKQNIMININEQVHAKRIKQTIIHELTHAFHYEHNACLEQEDNTEFIAEFNSRFLPNIYELYMFLYEKLIVLRGDIEYE